MPPAGLSEREGRWRCWEEFSRIGIFVAQYYLGTDFSSYVNAHAGLGSKGQWVIFADISDLGEYTIMRMGSGKVYAANTDDKINALLRIIFPPFPERGGVLDSLEPAAAPALPAALSFTV